MKYEVVIADNYGDTKYFYEKLSLKQAIKLAAVESIKNKNVFITWFRATDSQEGYYNPVEGHSPVGKTWH